MKSATARRPLNSNWKLKLKRQDFWQPSCLTWTNIDNHEQTKGVKLLPRENENRNMKRTSNSGEVEQ